MPQHNRGASLRLKLHDHNGEMTIRLAWRSLFLPFLASTAFVGGFLMFLWQVPAMRIMSLLLLGTAAVPIAIFGLIASIPLLALAMNYSPLLELRSADAVLRWHKNTHTLPLRDVAAFEAFRGEFSSNMPDRFTPYGRTYSQWRVRTVAGDVHVIWHASGSGRANLGILREFALAAGVPVEEYEASIREDKAKPEDRKVRITGLRRIS